MAKNPNCLKGKNKLAQGIALGMIMTN